MKSLFKIVIPSLLLVVFLAVITAIGDVDYEIPVSPSTISSISFYYENLGKKKIYIQCLAGWDGKKIICISYMR